MGSLSPPLLEWEIECFWNCDEDWGRKRHSPWFLKNISLEVIVVITPEQYQMYYRHLHPLTFTNLEV